MEKGCSFVRSAIYIDCTLTGKSRLRRFGVHSKASWSTAALRHSCMVHNQRSIDWCFLYVVAFTCKSYTKIKTNVHVHKNQMLELLHEMDHAYYMRCSCDMWHTYKKNSRASGHCTKRSKQLREEGERSTYDYFVSIDWCPELKAAVYDWLESDLVCDWCRNELSSDYRGVYRETIAPQGTSHNSIKIPCWPQTTTFTSPFRRRPCSDPIESNQHFWNRNI